MAYNTYFCKSRPPLFFPSTPSILPLPPLSSCAFSWYPTMTRWHFQVNQVVFLFWNNRNTQGRFKVKAVLWARDLLTAFGHKPTLTSIELTAPVSPSIYIQMNIDNYNVWILKVSKRSIDVCLRPLSCRSKLNLLCLILM